MGELDELLEGLAHREDVSVVVLTGGLPGYFVAHADLDDLSRLGRGEPVEGDPSSWGRALARIESMPQPVVAAINGQAWGGGCELSLACTLRIAARSAHLGQPEVNVGIIPGAGGTQRLPRAVGPGRAAELILSGRIIGADEAFSMGLVQAVLPDEDFVERAVEWVGAMAAKPRFALAAAKRAIVEGLRLPFEEGLRLEGRLFVGCQGDARAVALEERASKRYEDAPPGTPVEL
jgi:enoyl-CoA hydratase/carnithine racemase